MVKGLEHLKYDERLRALGLFSCKEKWQQGDRRYLMCRSKADGAGSSLVFGDRTKDNEYKLLHNKFHLYLRKNFFFFFLTIRVVRHWHSLPREAGAAPSLRVFNARLDRTLSNLVWWERSLPTAGDRIRWALRSLPAQTILWFYAHPEQLSLVDQAVSKALDSSVSKTAFKPRVC